PTGVGLPAMNSRIASRVGKPLRTRLTIASGRSRRFAGRCFLLGLGARGGFGLGAHSRLARAGFGGLGLRLRRLLRLRRRLAALALALLALGLLRLEQFDGGFERQILRLDRAGHRREQPVMGDIGAVTSLEELDRVAVIGVRAHGAQRLRRLAAPLARLGEENDGAIEADGQHVVLGGQRLEGGAVFQIGAEAADPGDDLLAGLRVIADVARQGEEPARRVEVDIGRRDAARQRDALWLAAVLAVAELNVDAIGTLAQADRLVAVGIDSERLGSAVERIGLAIAALDGERPRVAAFGVVRAADEGAELAELEAQPPGAAARAEPRVLAAAILREEVAAELLVERGDHLGDRQLLGAGDRRRELQPELAQHLLPVGAPARDIVELVLQIGGEIVLHQPVEEACEKGGDETAAILRHEALLVDLDVVAVLQDLDDRGIGRRSADAELLQPLDQAGLGIARQRLGEMLLRPDGLANHRLALGHRRQAAACALLLVGVVAILVVELEEAVELDDRAGGAQHDPPIAGGDIDRDLIEDRRFHLARHGAFPDQLVEAELIALERAAHRLRAGEEVGRADRLVGLLRVLDLVLVDARARRRVLAAVVAGYELLGGDQRIVREVDAVGPHIGDETDRLATYIDALVEALGERHRPAGAEAELARGLLL